MSTFRAVNTSLVGAGHPPVPADEATPTTPRPFVAEVATLEPSPEELSAKTPTRESFAGIVGQKPLPALPESATSERPDSKMGEVEVKSESPEASTVDDSNQDVEMTDSKDGKEESEHGSAEDDGRSSKKKKGQRFFCNEFPPCQLSFTRSEHLARHIRKHTGERPFQCHCNRRFSRLDNLRQHAQTVHVNEDIPGDSLAATGTRFQRQIRTDRVRPTNRSRASTLSAVPNPIHSHRGHSRNLSSSSITSMSSVSTFNGEDHRRHPYETPRPNRLSLDTYVPTSTPGPHHPLQPYYTGNNSPGGYSTPNSSYSIGNSSPRFSSGGLHSPASSVSRTLLWNSKTPNRRLSVPGSNPFQSSQSPDTYPSTYTNAVPSQAPVNNRNSSQFPSPASPTGSSRPESQAAAEAEWRRRTWHPNTNTQLRAPSTTITPQNAQHITDLPRPVFPSQQSGSQVPRLPGIHTFDQPPPPITLFAPRAPSPMQLDPPPTSHPTEDTSVPTNRVSWTAGIQTGINRLEITNESRSAAEPARSAEETQDQPPTPRRNKRMGWYMQPPASTPAPAPAPTPAPARPSPDSISSDGAPTPVTTAADSTPAIMHSNGHIETTQAMGAGHMPAIEEVAQKAVHVEQSRQEPIRPEVPRKEIPQQRMEYGGPRAEQRRQQQPEYIVHAEQPRQHRPEYRAHAEQPRQPDYPPQAYIAQLPRTTFGLDKVYENPIGFAHGNDGDMRRLEALVAVATSEEQRV